jgi:1-aminocyclopropane-1-carboxylate deaminase
VISYTATPIQEINDPLLQTAGVRLLVKREDLNHPHVSGNKWWKLKHNLAEAQRSGHDTMLTFGGAFSNHLFAVAAASRALGIKSIGIVRGEETLPLNHTLAFARKCGMQLHYVSRTDYREKTSDHFVSELREKFGRFFLLPEGGTNQNAVLGCREFGENLVAEVDFDFLCLPVGTGGTLAGMAQSLKPEQLAIGFSVLRDGDFLRGEVERWITQPAVSNWRIETRFDFGGYARTNAQLKEFIAAQAKHNQLPLDPVYTAKALYGIFAMVQQGEFPRSSVVLMVHTGGLQGAALAE